MPSNDEVLWGIPNVQCPTCESTLDMSGKRIHKQSKAQREQRHGSHDSCTQAMTNAPYRKRTRFDGEDEEDQCPENAFVVVSCGNERCSQYNKVKVFRIPRLHAPSIKLEL